jgi:hypothetical protein
MTRLERSLRLLRTINRFRLTACKWPRHVAGELAYYEGQLQELDAAAALAAEGDLRAIDRREDPRQVRMPWR